MIPQLVRRMELGLNGPAVPLDEARNRVLTGDPLDLVLHLEQVWEAAGLIPPIVAPPLPTARQTLWTLGVYREYVPSDNPAWDHLGYSFALENTRAVQIMRRVVREYRNGEGLGTPSQATQRWLDATEVLLFGAANPLASWLSTSTVRQDAEAIRRNAYWRFFGFDLAFRTEDNRPPAFDKATAANTGFVQPFEELLSELWQAITNVRNLVGVNQTDDDRIFRLAEQLQYQLRSRRLAQNLAREELAAATVLSWVELTLSADTPVVVDLRAQATNPADRLRLIGERVGLPAHPRSTALFSMAADLSLFLRTIESDLVRDPRFSWVLYLQQPPPGSPLPPGAPASFRPIGEESRRVITEWGAARDKDLKARTKPVETVQRPRMITVN